MARPNKKYTGSANKGFAKANQNRTINAITKAYRDGRSPKTDRKLAKMLDRLYSTDFIARYHAAN